MLVAFFAGSAKHRFVKRSPEIDSRERSVVFILHYFFPALFFAHRAFNAATIFARPSGLNPPFFFAGLAAGPLATAVDVPFDLAHLARCAAAIRSRASGDMVRLPVFATAVEANFGTDPMDELPPTRLASWA